MPQKCKFCDHCSEYVAISTFKRHKMNYYDEGTKQWTIMTGKRQDKGRLLDEGQPLAIDFCVDDYDVHDQPS